jgi:type IV pilus assembly protein PilO
MPLRRLILRSRIQTQWRQELMFDNLAQIDFQDPASWPWWLKIVGTLAVCGGILYAGYYFVVKDQIETLNKAEQKEQQLKVTYEKKKALAVNLPAYRSQMKEMKESFGVMLRQLPDQTEVPELLIEITQAGIASGLDFLLFKPQKKRKADFYAILPIDLKVRGTYHQFAGFISDLAGLSRIVTIGNISISPGKGKSKAKGGLLTMSAITHTYHYLDESQITSQKAASAADKKKTRSRKKKKSG